VLFDFQFDTVSTFLEKHDFPAALVMIFFVLNFVTYKKPDLIKRLSNMRLRYWAILITFLLFLIVLFYDGNPEDFIYFRF